MNSVRIRLFIMMFLQYFAWGAWFVTLGNFIGSNTGKGDGSFFAEGFIGIAYGTAAIGGMIAPFFVGAIADRYFSTERILAVLHITGAGVLYYLSTVSSQEMFYGTLIIYFICYMPTLALTNSLSFHHLDNPAKQFPAVRVLGTIGWIAAGLLVGLLKTSDGHFALMTENFFGTGWEFSIGSLPGDPQSIEATTIPMQIAVGAQLLLGLFCLVLPHTPPTNTEGRVTIGGILGLDALKLLKDWPFAVFVIGSFLVAIPLQFYYNYTNFFLNDIQTISEATGDVVKVRDPAALMILGQVSEIFFMLLMPLFFIRLGIKKMLLIAMVCWAARYTLFAYGDPDAKFWMLLIGILLHGICYDFFFVTGQIYVDNKAHEKIRGAAQGFIAFATLGVGSFIGANLSGLAETTVLRGPDGAMHWTNFWMLPAAGAGLVLILFAVLFNDKSDAARGKSVT